jgi:energy-converting hydrogenase Eha subunit E
MAISSSLMLAGHAGYPPLRQALALFVAVGLLLLLYFAYEVSARLIELIAVAGVVGLCLRLSLEGLCSFLFVCLERIHLVKRRSEKLVEGRIARGASLLAFYTGCFSLLLVAIACVNQEPSRSSPTI